MTLQDLSNGFDVLLNSYSSRTGVDIRLDEYEKSVFLTKAAKLYIKSLYTGKNEFGDSFESSEEMRRSLSYFVKDTTLTASSSSSITGMGDDSLIFELPSDLWFITYESLKLSDTSCSSITEAKVVPVTQDEYHQLKQNPFRGTGLKRALRLDIGDNTVEIISSYSDYSYYIRYMMQVPAIILTDLSDNLTIDGESSSSLDIPEILHQGILEKAVLLAIQSRTLYKS